VSDKPQKNNFLGAKARLWLAAGLAGVAVLAAIFAVYLDVAFPRVRCPAAKHLESPENVSDCYKCHLKSTPKVAQDWYESKHGVMLVKCFVCHGQPDGKGSIPFAVNPNVLRTCLKCHEPSMKKMQAKYGLEPKCNNCHPFHHNSLHHKAYEKTKAKKKVD
jgi:hypothetical protein